MNRLAACLLATLALAVFLPLAAAADPSPPAAPKAAASPTAPADSERPATPASTTGAWKPSTKTHPTQVTIFRERGGRKALAIEYRWKVHRDASVEVRLVPAERGEGTFVTPLDFFGEYLKPSGKSKSYDFDLQKKIYRCLDRGGDAGLTETFNKDKMDFKIVGQRNTLGRSAVYVLAANEGKPPEDRADAIFLQLDSWAVDDTHLNLDLSPDIFEKPGKLFVWFLRGDRLLWEKQVDWPGAGTAAKKP